MKTMSSGPKAFSNRRITIDQAIGILKRNGIQADEDQGRIILDFLYLIARTMFNSGTLDRGCYGPLGEIEHQDC
jgi:hypothetical protein